MMRDEINSREIVGSISNALRTNRLLSSSSSTGMMPPNAVEKKKKRKKERKENQKMNPARKYRKLLYRTCSGLSHFRCIS
jgi:hypothetical protein